MKQVRFMQKSKINQKMNTADISMLVVLSVLWGGSFFFVEVLIPYLPLLTIVSSRVALAAIVLWILIIALKLPLPQKISHWKALFMVGLLNNAVPFSLIAWGQTQISSGMASILNATTPFFTVLVAGFVLVDERFTKRRVLGVILGFIGVIVLLGPAVHNELENSVLGQITVLGAALSYAFAAVYARRFREWGLSPLMVATGQATTASFFLLPISLVIDKPWTLFPISVEVAGAIAGLALLSTVLAYMLYFRLIDSAGATNAALVTLLIPVSAILLGVILLGEVFSASQAVGMGVIGVGLIVMDGRLAERLASKITRKKFRRTVSKH